MGRIATFAIGSTNFRYAIGTTAGQLLTDIRTKPTNHHGLAHQIIDTLDILQTEGWSPSVVSICCAGLVDSTTGTIELMHTPDGEEVRQLALADAIEEATNLRTVVENDCTAAVLGEYVYGAGKDYRSVIHLTMGTGIGAGVIDHGQILRGERDRAMEPGFLPVKNDSALTVADVPGSWEAYCSGRGIPDFITHYLSDFDQETELTPGDATAEELFRLATADDPGATAILAEINRYNAIGIATLVNLLDPGIVTLGGGIVLNNPNHILTGIEDHLDTYLLEEAPPIDVTPLGGDIGIYGALARPDWED